MPPPRTVARDRRSSGGSASAPSCWQDLLRERVLGVRGGALDLVPGLLDVGLGLVGLALGLQAFVVGRLADRLLGLAGCLLGTVLDLVSESHHVLLAMDA